MKSFRFAILSLLVIGAVGFGVALAGLPTDSGAKGNKRFVIIVHETPAEFSLREDKTDAGKAYWAGWMAYAQSLESAGVNRGGMPLARGEEGNVVRVIAGKVEAKPIELRADRAIASGYFVIEVPTLEEAVAWAGKVPNATRSHVEVRTEYPVPMPTPVK